MGDSLVFTYERVDITFKEGLRRVEYYVDRSVYDSLSKVAEHIVRCFDRLKSVDRFSLYRANLQSLVNVRPHELEERCRECPAIHMTREGSRVINASGDGDDLFKLQGMIAEIRPPVGVNR